MKCVGGHVVANGVCCACCQGRIIHKMNWLAGMSGRKQVFFHPLQIIRFLRQKYSDICNVCLLKDQSTHQAYSVLDFVNFFFNTITSEESAQWF